METTNKTSSEILLEAADLLEQESRWGKGIFLERFSPGVCRMCAHGAIAFCGNLEVKRARYITTALPAMNAASNIASHAAYYQNLAQKENLTLEQYIVKYYCEVGLAHYKAWKIGLTYDFNDRYNTTKQDVINKLREAAMIL